MNLSLLPFVPNSILDIGANVGGFYNEAKTSWPHCQIVCIEANPNCGDQLKAVCKNAIIMAIGRPGVSAVKLWMRHDAPTCTGVSTRRELTEFYEGDKAYELEVPCQALDDTVFPIFDLVKIDVQGGELDVIAGGQNVLGNARAVIMEVSIEQYNEGAPLSDEVTDAMDDLGFVPQCSLQQIVHPIKRHHIQDDMLFVKV